MSAVWTRPAGAGVEERPTPVERTGVRRNCHWRRAVAILAVVVVASVGIAKWRTAASTATAPSAPARPLNVHSLGYLEPASEVIRLAAPATSEQARIERLLVKEGDEVAVGDVVAILDNFDRRSAAVAEATARIDVEKARLEQIKAGAKPGDLAAQRAMVSRAKAVLAESKLDLARSEQLVSRKAAPAAELDDAKLKVESSVEELRQAEAAFESLSEVRDVDVRQQELQIVAAEASLAMACAELATTQVRAPIEGRILKICVRPGERVADDGIIEIGDLREMYAVAEVYEADLPRVVLGQRAAVRLFTGEGEELQGEVAEIGLIVGKKDILANDPVADTDARVVEVRVRLRPSDAHAVERLSNARVEVTIETDPETEQPAVTVATVAGQE